ncbi:LCP family protein [bacterium]|nr:LCP family protein [bacterium]
MLFAPRTSIPNSARLSKTVQPIIEPSRMGDPALSEDLQQKPRKGWLGDRPVRSLLRISAALLGTALAGTALATIWPKPDPAGADVQSSNGSLTLAPLPEQAVMVLVVGLDADTINAPSNNAAPQGPANADSLMLVNISTKQPVQILQLPTELAVQLPGIEEMQALSTTWQHGGIALTSDVVGELIDLPVNKPDRYLVLSRQGLRRFVEGLGDIEVTLNQTYKHEDKAQGYSVNLQAGLQTLNGAQAEQLARHKPKANNDHQRRVRQQLLLQGVHQQLAEIDAVTVVPELLNVFSNQVTTDISSTEMLSLIGAAINAPSSPVITELPLAARAGQQRLRELKPDLILPIWPDQN